MMCDTGTEGGAEAAQRRQPKVSAEAKAGAGAEEGAKVAAVLLN